MKLIKTKATIEVEVYQDLRILQLEAMHEVMKMANDELIYASWIEYGIPDEPSDENFESIAEDEVMYLEIYDLFVKLVARRGYTV
jgi:hypothetical protein